MRPAVGFSAPRAVGGGSLSRVLVSEVVDFAEIAPREHSCLSLTDTTECLTPERPKIELEIEVPGAASRKLREHRLASTFFLFTRLEKE